MPCYAGLGVRPEDAGISVASQTPKQDKLQRQNVRTPGQFSGVSAHSAFPGDQDTILCVYLGAGGLISSRDDKVTSPRVGGVGMAEFSGPWALGLVGQNWELEFQVQ